MLVLVMTLLGILFVVGVAFLATMNFEADMISAERLRSQSDGGVEAAAETAGSIISNSVMAGPGIPFGDSSAALSGTAFAELPGVQNTFSPIEPIRRIGPDGLPFTGDDTLVFEGYFDAQAHSKTTFDGPSLPAYFAIDTNLVNGTGIGSIFITIGGAPVEIILGRCKGAPDDGNLCDPTNPCTAPSVCDYPRVADADGDGIVDSLLIDAREMGLSDAQLVDLAARVNPSSDLNGQVSVALRVVPHGGMVNLNESHPSLIQNLFDLSAWPTPAQVPNDPETGFRHGPTQDGLAYAPALEEALLRRRNNVPPREFQPSYLHGNPFDPDQTDSAQAHMQRQLFWSKWPGGAAANQFQNVYSQRHDFTPFAVAPTTLNPTGEKLRNYPSNPDYKYWDVMMDAQLAAVASSIVGEAIDYDKRHLATTVSHDDLLARTGMISTPQGRKDLRQAMIEANWTNFDPDQCLPLMPFEIVNYPMAEEEEIRRQNYDKSCCPDSASCEPGPTKGRMQLSLPWIDDQLAAAASTSLSLQQQNEYRDRIYRVIHDAFYMLVQNAAQSIEVEGTVCASNDDCMIADTICSPNFLCVHRGRTAPFTGCVTSSDCELGFPGSMCRSDGVCTLAAPAWRDMECPANACNSDEYCQMLPGATVGVCAERWTLLRRSDALVARTAASLTANMIDFVDSDNTPTQIAIRNFDFGLRCNGGGNHNYPCLDNTGCPSGTCMKMSGRDIDLNSTQPGIQGVYVYGLERHPYISEVASLAVDAGGGLPVVVARAIEFINPYNSTVFLDNEYFILEVPQGANTTVGLPLIGLNGVIVPNTGASATGPFSTLVTAESPAFRAELRDPPKGVELAGTGNLTFLSDYTIYLLRSLDPTDPNATKIVVDQFSIGTTHHVGEEGPGLQALGICGGSTLPPCRFSVQRMVSQPATPGVAATAWTWSVPYFGGEDNDGITLGAWNSISVQNNAIHPVEVNFSNSGQFGMNLTSTKTPSFPSTGSVSLLMRTAARSMTDFSPPVIAGATGAARELAFNSTFDDFTTANFRDENPVGNWQLIANQVQHLDQIDNGRLPIFDVGMNGQPIHHLPPRLYKPWDPTGTLPNGAAKAMPGDLRALPWGQLLFDYFTAIPLSNRGPYEFDTSDPDETKWSYAPRVDEGGLRVHGRININAAPWKVLAGLPLVPANQIPVEFRTKITNLVGADTFIGDELAQAIVAYRDGRAIPDGTGAPVTGDYGTGLPPVGVAPNQVAFGRGWTLANPAVRRGTGFMSVGELANVRHLGAAVGGPFGSYRIDIERIDLDNQNNKDQNFIEAAAVLIALGDWVSVRSHVFTVYGQIRGADDPTIADPVMRLMDSDARAIRFQETIDRLPVLQGRGKPTRIGERTVGQYTDVNND